MGIAQVFALEKLVGITSLNPEQLIKLDLARSAKSRLMFFSVKSYSRSSVLLLKYFKLLIASKRLIIKNYAILIAQVFDGFWSLSIFLLIGDIPR
jgi:hypothetical protein